MIILAKSARLLSCAIVMTAASPAVAQQTPAAAAQPVDPAVEGVGKALAAFVKAFNAHDAAALAALWKEDAVHVARGTGARTEGRKALQDAYAKLFKDDPKCELSIAVNNVRFVAPSVAHLEGIADEQHTTGDVSRSEFSAILSQQNGAWLIDQVHESDVPLASSTASAGLSQLDWFIGIWVDEANDGNVANEIRWADNLNFLVRTYRQQQTGATVREGMQIIGWDAEDNCIRSWVFDGDGTFGEGVWTPEGEDKWVNKLVLKLPDGRRGSLTQVVERTGDDKFTVQTIDRQLDGAPQPNSEPVSLARSGNKTAQAPGSEATEVKP